MTIMDTLIWLLNFPVTHGYVLIFIAGFSFLGLGALAARPVGGSSSVLDRLRAREGLPAPTAPAPARLVWARLQRLGFRLLLLVVVGSGILGLLGLIGVPVTSAYIHAHGVTGSATVDGDWVTFTAEDGKTYTLRNDFFTSSVYPSDAYVSSGEGVPVRYLPGHPQAYVIDAEALNPR